MFICISRIVSMFIFFQKPLRTWEKIEDHRTSIKEHEKWKRVKNEVLCSDPCVFRRLSTLSICCVQFPVDINCENLFFVFVLLHFEGIMKPFRSAPDSYRSVWSLNDKHLNPVFFKFDQSYNCPRMSIEQPNPSIIGTSK